MDRTCRVTIFDGNVGAGSFITKDISKVITVGNLCKIIRPITDKNTLEY